MDARLHSVVKNEKNYLYNQLQKISSNSISFHSIVRDIQSFKILQNKREVERNSVVAVRIWCTASTQFNSHFAIPNTSVKNKKFINMINFCLQLAVYNYLCQNYAHIW